MFGPSTRNSVVVFQQIYNLPQTGVIDRATWYQISRIYAIEKALWEMNSEGIRIGIGTTPPTAIIREGSTGRLVTELQFLLDFIAMYHSAILFVAETSRFDSLTTTAVREFQRIFGLTADGDDVIIGLCPKSQQSWDFMPNGNAIQWQCTGFLTFTSWKTKPVFGIWTYKNPKYSSKYSPQLIHIYKEMHYSKNTPLTSV